jgi:CCR4-NOT transcription complex subunit 9
MYPNQQNNLNYPSLTHNEDNNPPPEANDQEELNNIVQYIKNLKDPLKREEVTTHLT